MISILANVGQAAYALPMVQAYPTDVNLQQLLSWDTVNQALNYVPYTGNSSGDFGVGRDLAVARDAAIVRDATIGGTLGVTGLATLTAGIAGSLTVAANVSFTGQLNNTGTKVLGTRITGWADPTGTATRTTFATGSVTLPQLAERVMALILDLKTHGLIGA